MIHHQVNERYAVTSMYEGPAFVSRPGGGSAVYQVLNCLSPEHDWRLVALAGSRARAVA